MAKVLAWSTSNNFIDAHGLELSMGFRCRNGGFSIYVESSKGSMDGDPAFMKSIYYVFRELPSDGLATVESCRSVNDMKII